jgi:antirestriction protein ArdC
MMDIAEEKKAFPERVAEKLIEQLKQGTAPWQNVMVK